jgi:hypothetical protein
MSARERFVLVDPAFVRDVRRELRSHRRKDYGEVGEQGGGLVLRPGDPPVLVSLEREQGAKKSVTIPRSRWVWHTHPATCHPSVGGCSVEPPSDKDMLNAVNAALSVGQRASIVFGHSRTYVVSVRREFLAWARAAALPRERLVHRVKLALDRYQRRPSVPRGTGPFYRKLQWHRAFIKGWLTHAASIRFRAEDGHPASPHVFAIYCYPASAPAVAVPA